MELHFFSGRPLLKWSEWPEQSLSKLRIAIYTDDLICSAPHHCFSGSLFCHPFSAFFGCRVGKGSIGKERTGMKGKERIGDSWPGTVWEKWDGGLSVGVIMTIRNNQAQNRLLSGGWGRQDLWR